VDRYLLGGALPAAGTVCHSPMQPFKRRVSMASATAQAEAKQLPPVAGPYAASPLTLEYRP
jgi:hypothetical protein